MLLKLNLARNSLRYIIKTYNIKELHIPFYICPAIRQAILKEGCRPLFYHIDDNFMPQREFSENDFILYPNYFGICDKNVDILTKKYPKLILDNAHSFFSEPKGFACFNSARKFLPVYNGSYLWIKKVSFIPQIAETPLNYDIKNENNFDELEILQISKELENYILTFSKENKFEFLKLHEKYKETNNLNIDINCKSPFCYPYLAKTNEQADKLVKELERNGKIIYRYWNNMPENFNEYKFYKRLVPIPIINLF